MKFRLSLVPVLISAVVISCSKHAGIEPVTPDMANVSYQAKSAKRGVSYNFDQLPQYDIPVLGPAISWSYNWSSNVPSETAQSLFSEYGMDWCPMIWNGNYSPDNIRTYKKAHPEAEYILAFNEPNLTDQANMTPAQAAEYWPDVVALADELGMKLISPAMNYGTLAGYNDPWKWLDEFFDQPGVSLDDVDGIAVHCYMGSATALMDYIDGFRKYGKPIWLTEFCNWDNDNISAEQQMKFMVDAINLLEADHDVFRYAWFIPRGNGEEKCHNSLITSGRPPFSLTELGEVFVNLSTQDKNLYYTPGQIIQSEHYSACQGGITVEPTTDEAGLLHIGNLVAGQKVEYQVDVPGGTRQMELRVRTYLATSVDFTVNGSKVTVNLPDTGRSWSTITVELPFADGKQTIAIEGTNDISPMFNWFRIL